LDNDDLTDVLVTFEGPGETGVRFSTDASDALADFINSDTDGIITLLISASAEETSLIIRSREHSAGGTLLEGDIAPIANIIWVSDRTPLKREAANVVPDAGFVELLRSAGYIVDYKGEIDSFEWDDPNNPDDPVALTDEFHYWQNLDPNKMAELEATDLIIVSRNASSGAYDDVTDFGDERVLWNSITTPMISMSAHLARIGYNKWGWVDTKNNPYTAEPFLTVLDPTHALFDGVVLDANDQVDIYTDEYNVEGINIEGATNGIILATRAAGPDNVEGMDQAESIMIATWETGQQFASPPYESSGGYPIDPIAGGPRMFFAAGSGSKADRIDTCLGDGTYNLTENGEKVFLNAVEYMLPSEALPIVANWPLDDGAGTTATDIVGGNDGTLVGGVTWLAEGGASFDNIDGSHIEVANSDALDFGDEDFTISMLVRYPVPAVDTDRWIIKGTHGDPGTGNRYEVFQTSGDEMRFTIDNDAVGKSRLQVPGSNEKIMTGEWVHIVAVRDTANDLMSVYIDGELMGTQTDTSGDISSGEPLWIGESTDEETTAMSGDICDVRIFNVALTEDEIAAIY